MNFPLLAQTGSVNETLLIELLKPQSDVSAAEFRLHFLEFAEVSDACPCTGTYLTVFTIA